MADITKTVAPKTDQLNADDLLGGKTKIITITGVKEFSTKDQPIGIHYEGDNGKPWKPCLGMRRVLIELWGEDAAKAADQNYRGRRVTLYRDPDIKFGNAIMGGIRISHASHIQREVKINLTVAKARRIEYFVKPLAESTTSASNAPAQTQNTQADDRKAPADPEAYEKAKRVYNAIKAENDLMKIDEIFEVDFKPEMDWLKKEGSPRFQWLIDECEKRKSFLRNPDQVNSLMGG